MERISVFDIFKIGIGPSSSHTMGPWKAALDFIQMLGQKNIFDKVEQVEVELFGSLAKTGVGHGTDLAVVLGLSGYHPETIPVEKAEYTYKTLHNISQLNLGGIRTIPFDARQHILFHKDQSLPKHANALMFRAFLKNQTSVSDTYYSVGGGFIVKEGSEDLTEIRHMPYPIDSAFDVKKWCSTLNYSISSLVMQNELALKSENQIQQDLLKIYEVMLDCIYQSCQKEGELPGGLKVQRRAKNIADRLLGGRKPNDAEQFFQLIRTTPTNFTDTLNWLSCFALAVNEENAAFGRIVTAPTNGAAGVIPAVLMYHICFNQNKGIEDVYKFLLTAGEIGSLFKKGATISAAMGGCQAEIGVSSAMAAAGLTEVLGGNYEQCLMASEIAMEHHLGMTCDPIGGLVQVPCIERNTMGAIKAVTAAQIALQSDPSKALVSLDAVIKTMKETAFDMNHKYKETADGGLAIHIPVNIVEC
ncbi:MAG: L-serine ammonia-lyase [Saprospiraceae bacterium]|nr:L-serine ammonia-lyase [Saprospiraceae bacterium]